MMTWQVSKLPALVTCTCLACDLVVVRGMSHQDETTLLLSGHRTPGTLAVNAMFASETRNELQHSTSPSIQDVETADKDALEKEASDRKARRALIAATLFTVVFMGVEIAGGYAPQLLRQLFSANFAPTPPPTHQLHRLPSHQLHTITNYTNFTPSPTTPTAPITHHPHTLPTHPIHPHPPAHPTTRSSSYH